MKKVLLLILILLSLNIKSKPLKINGGTFDLDIYVYTGTDTTYLKREIGDITKIEINGCNFEARGLTFYNYSYPIVIWFPEYPKDNSILNHELLHAVIALMQWANIPLTNETEEIYTYELQYLTKQLEHVR